MGMVLLMVGVVCVGLVLGMVWGFSPHTLDDERG
jgi:hypothetical protein